MSNITFIFVFVAVLALIGVAAWLVRQFATSRLGANTNRGRMPRLAVIDAAAVDGRRRLVLVRRDNVEHLLMIGGPTDIVVEPNIVRATPGREALPQRPPGTELPPRIAPLPDAAGWADGDAGEAHVEPQMPEPPPRPARPSFAEEVRRPAPPPLVPERERRSDPFGRIYRRAWPHRASRARAASGTAARAKSRITRRTAPDRPEPMPPRMPRSEPVMPRGEPLMPRANRPAEPPKAPRSSCRTYLSAAASCLRRRRRRARTRISPRWRSVSKPRFAAPRAAPMRRRLRRSRRPDAARARSPRHLRPELRQKPALKISKTRWPLSLAVRSRRLRERRKTSA